MSINRQMDKQIVYSFTMKSSTENEWTPLTCHKDEPQQKKEKGKKQVLKDYIQYATTLNRPNTSKTE